MNTHSSEYTFEQDAQADMQASAKDAQIQTTAQGDQIQSFDQSITSTQTDMHAALEALLFVSDKPVCAKDLAALLACKEAEVTEALVALSKQYQNQHRGIQLRQLASGWQLCTHPDYFDLLSQFILSWDIRRLSQAAFETLAIVSYQQPTTRDAIRAIRGVNSDGVIASLKDKGYIKELKAKQPGASGQLVTTPLFLEHFGLSSLNELPPLEDFAPDDKMRQLIRERLTGQREPINLGEGERDT